MTDRQIHLRPAHPRRQTPAPDATTSATTLVTGPDAPCVPERCAHLRPREHGARTATLRHHRRRPGHDGAGSPARGPPADRRLHRTGGQAQRPEVAGTPDSHVRRASSSTGRLRRWKPKTRETNARHHASKDILPAFGGMTVDAVTAEHVRDWFASMSARPGIANRAMPVLAHDDEDGGAVGLPRPQLQPVPEHPALPHDNRWSGS